MIDLDTISNCQQMGSTRVGTDYYLSPELRAAYVSKHPVSLAMWRGGDRFALAVMMYELYHVGRMDDGKTFAALKRTFLTSRCPCLTICGASTGL